MKSSYLNQTSKYGNNFKGDFLTYIFLHLPCNSDRIFSCLSLQTRHGKNSTIKGPLELLTLTLSCIQTFTPDSMLGCIQ